MATIRIPYHRSELSAVLPDANLLGCYHASFPPPAADPTAQVRAALDAPIASPSLARLAEGKRSAVVIASDHTRPVPSRILMPPILESLRRGSPAIDITLLIATGFHRATTRAELEGKFGPEIVAREKIVVHDGADRDGLVALGRLPSGGELLLNRRLVETDLLLAEGFIEPHFFAGFSGGRKSVLPGVAARETVLANHCSEFIQSPFARAGVLDGNPIHRDMIFAAEKAGLAFIANVVLTPEKQIARVFAGHFDRAHREGCDFLRAHADVTVPEADVVVTGNGGYPLDQNVYQAVKGMTAGETVCRPGGVIVMVAGCADGHGGEDFHRRLAEASGPEELLARAAAVPRDRTEPDQWEYQILARILARHRVILVTRDCDHALIRSMHLDVAGDLQEAVDKALALAGMTARVAVIPDGVSVMARKQVPC